MANLTNVQTITSANGDVLDLNPLTYNGAELLTTSSVPTLSGGDGIAITNDVVSVDLYTTAVSSQTLNINGLNPVIDGQYQFERFGCINNGVFYNTSTPRTDAPTYALFSKPDGARWDVVFCDDAGAWHSATVSTDPGTWGNLTIAPFTETPMLVAVSSGPTDESYLVGSDVYRSPDAADPNVSYSSGSATVGESYLELINGKLRVNITELEAALLGANDPMDLLDQTYTAVSFDYASGMVPIPDMIAGKGVTDVRISMDTPFNAPVAFSIGTPNDVGSVIPVGAFNPTIPGVQLEWGWHDIQASDYNLYVGTGATSGEGRLLIQMIGS